ncbi:MAG: 1-(5-phosphoribosyl)-5-[(5-phosphoribosylamino)methylideneamino]imidazole-4-carboxamide isomerase [Coriobacteriia bacterium]|nr:1-(5-phosphoribosyl)-5-[(5-phosphoribosylamino)methylideneamino]imidazole-4-carboxamide isomerase [Coriobacteriia bacterium]
MLVFPAIDILRGQAVRLAQGDYERVTVYNDSACAQALEWAELGARGIHIVDLDGARTGNPENIEIVSSIAREIGVPIEVGGGVRTLKTAVALLEAGVARVVIGTKLATDFDFVQKLVSELGSEHLVAGVDAKNGLVATQGWIDTTEISSIDLVVQLSTLGLSHLVYTDISRDGMQTGIDMDLYSQVAVAAGFPVIVSGGVSTLHDFEKIKAAGDTVAEGVITGRALYEGAFTLPEALAVFSADNATETRGSGSAPC